MIPPGIPVSEEMIQAHWRLERALAQGLLDSLPSERGSAFREAYTRFYSEVHWLNVDSGATGEGSSLHYATWASLLGDPPAAVYEVGAGRGELLHTLARLGYMCKGSEITGLRGAGAAQAHPHVTWGETDGVHLDRYEDAETYDVVLSNHVIEHLHPADLPEHLASAWRLLRPAGCYVLATPNRLWGPWDVSRFFGLRRSAGLHLREYGFREMTSLLGAAGFADVAAVLCPPLRLVASGRMPARAGASQSYLRYLEAVEALISALPPCAQTRVARSLRNPLFPGAIWLKATKPTTSSMKEKANE